MSTVFSDEYFGIYEAAFSTVHRSQYTIPLHLYHCRRLPCKPRRAKILLPIPILGQTTERRWTSGDREREGAVLDDSASDGSSYLYLSSSVEVYAANAVER